MTGIRMAKTGKTQKQEGDASKASGLRQFVKSKLAGVGEMSRDVLNQAAAHFSRGKEVKLK